MTTVTVLVPNKGCWDVPKNAFARRLARMEHLERAHKEKKNRNLHLILNSEPAFSK